MIVKTLYNYKLVLLLYIIFLFCIVIIGINYDNKTLFKYKLTATVF